MSSRHSSATNALNESEGPESCPPQAQYHLPLKKNWIPACAGMTMVHVHL